MISFAVELNEVRLEVGAYHSKDTVHTFDCIGIENAFAIPRDEHDVRV